MLGILGFFDDAVSGFMRWDVDIGMKLAVIFFFFRKNGILIHKILEVCVCARVCARERVGR